MKVGTWNDYYSPQEKWIALNKISLQVINLLNDSTPNCVAHLKENHNLVALTLDPMTAEVLMIHHLTEIGGSLLSSEKQIVALIGFGSQGTALRFKSSEDLLSFVVDVEVPSSDAVSKFDTAKEFLELKPEAKSTGRFRNILLLPPFVAAVLLAVPSSSPSEWAALLKAAAENIKTELDGTNGFNPDDFDEAVLCALRWLWCANQGSLTAPCLGFKSDDLSTAWSKNLHDTCLLVPSESVPVPSSVAGPSSEALNSLSLIIWP